MIEFMSTTVERCIFQNRFRWIQLREEQTEILNFAEKSAKDLCSGCGPRAGVVSHLKKK